MKRLVQRSWSFLFALALILLAVILSHGHITDAASNVAALKEQKNHDRKLLDSLPGFESKMIEVNGINIHYVEGGSGDPLILLPGWPQTWWEFHKIMPELAAHYRVIVVELRGMGGSDKPVDGYDKKTMASDIYELIQSRGFEKVYVAGHDIGSQVTYSLVANYPEVIWKAVMMDVPHPDETYKEVRMLPGVGTFGDKIDADHPGFTWWFAFNQVKQLPEQMLEGRYHMLQNWAFNYLTKDSASISESDRLVYYDAYKSQDAIRAGNAWYQAFPQDIEDSKSYGKTDVPILALGSIGYESLMASLPNKANNFQVVKVENSGHYIVEEQTQFVLDQMLGFFTQSR